MAGIVPGDLDSFKVKLRELWFDLYDRGTSGSSSGFEHVFLGEIRDGSISGFHNWIFFAQEEREGRNDYLGYLGVTDFGRFGSGITNVHRWKGAYKCIGGFFIGTRLLSMLYLMALRLVLLQFQPQKTVLFFLMQPRVGHGHEDRVRADQGRSSLQSQL